MKNSKNMSRVFLLIIFCLTLTGISLTADAAEYRLPEEVTGMDLDGNVYVIEDEAGVFENTTNPYSRDNDNIVVNFNTKGMSAVTEYKEDKTGVDGYTCGGYGADGAYLGEQDGKVKFMLSGVIGLVDKSEVQLVKFGDALSVSHYKVKDGRLIHYVTTNMTKDSYGSVLDQGPAPSYLAADTKYYSYDGHYFYSDYNAMLSDYAAETRSSSVNKDNPYFNYFQFLPLRSKTQYTSDELTSMINNKAGSESGMYDLGNSFISNQNKYGVNAIIATGIAANESAWGKSNIAKEKNNLFGLNAVDSSPGESANYYPSTDACVKEFTQYYMSQGYLYPKDWRYLSGALGNKAGGINVKYASDPYWGEKAANVAWMFSKENQPKDVYVYSIGIKNIQSHSHSEVNVRNKPTTDGSAVLFTTPGSSGYPVIILGEENGFFEIQSDGIINSDRTSVDKADGVYDYTNMYAYISKDYVTQVMSGSSKPEPEPEKPVLKEGWNSVDGKWYYVENGVKLTDCWKKIDGSWFYFEKDGAAATGFKEINGYWYYFDSSCYMKTGWQKIDENWYYFNDDGSAAKGWKKFEDKWCFFEEKGLASTGLKNIDGKYYYFGTDCYMRTGWRQIENNWYYFGSDGSAVTGWNKLDGNWFYFDENGIAARGLTKIENDYYYFDDNCYMQTGWQEVEGNRYYFDENGKGKKGLYKESGKLYYFDEECRMQTGWQEVEGNRYYFDENGVAVSGLKKIDEELYCFDENCIMYTGWYNLDDGKCYFDTDGKAVKGLKKIDNELYFFNDEYIMQTGWQEVEGNKYYFYADGKAAKGLLEIDGKLYYFNEECQMHTGWKYISKNWYYFNESGEAATDWSYIENDWYYFTDKGVMITGWKYIDGYWYYFREGGAAARQWRNIDGNWYYFNGNCVMITGWKYIDGYWYYFKESGAAATGWKYIDGNWYYFNGNCVMITGWKYIDGYWYYFYKDGSMARNTWVEGNYVNDSGVWIP